MNRLVYEKSVSYKGHLIIPFVFRIFDQQPIYSYQLLSELGHKGKFNKSENPARIYSSIIDDIFEAAKAHLDENLDVYTFNDYFQHRYTYCHNLIIIYEAAGKYFYDHYKPDNLNNVAAPKIFKSEQDCINWIKEGLDRSSTDQEVKTISG